MKLTFETYPDTLKTTQAAFEKGDPQGLLDLLLVIRPFEESLQIDTVLPWMKKGNRPEQAAAVYQSLHHANLHKNGKVTDPTGNIQYTRGWLSFHAVGLEQDTARAMKDWREAAEERGHLQAACHLGNCHFNGQVTPKDRSEARRYWTMAATKGHAQSQCNLGDHFSERGKDNAAFEAYSAAAEQGHPTAQYKLARIQSFSSDFGNPRKDLIQAAKWMEQAAAQGISSAQKKLPALQQELSSDHAQVYHIVTTKIETDADLRPDKTALRSIVSALLKECYVDPKTIQPDYLGKTLKQITPDYRQRGAIDPLHHRDLVDHLARAQTRGWTQRVEQEMTELPRARASAAAAGAGRS